MEPGIPSGALHTAGSGPRIQDLSIRAYRLPLCRPWQSARGVFAERRGWLVRTQSDGVLGYGDCAPLPAAGTESPDSSARALAAWETRLRGVDIDTALSLLAGGSGAAPAAVTAMECSLLDLQSRLFGHSLRRRIAAGAGVPDSVPVNAALGAVGRVRAADIALACECGFRVLKLKIGLTDPDSELVRLAEIARALPGGVRLRLDANGAWDGTTAARVVSVLNDLPVESLEEPLGVAHPGTLARLQSLAVFPLALDESLPPLLARLDQAPLPVRRAVLKPPVIGGLRRTLTLARRLEESGTEVVLTSLVESAAGLWATVQLAAAIGSPLHQGLDTARWLASDLGPAPIPQSGRIRLPDGAGSGFHPHVPEGNHA